MIVDCHTHIVEDYSTKATAARATVDDLLRNMDEHGVDMAVVIPLPGWASNEFVQAQCQRHPDRLLGMYNPDFSDPLQTLPRMDKFCANHDVRCIKIHPRLQPVNVQSPITREVVGWAVEHRLPVMFDVFQWGPLLDDPALYPLAYHRLAQDFPEATIILAHGGGLRVLDAFMVAKCNPNVILDMSLTLLYFAGSSIEKDILFVCDRLPPGRVMYGSDFPDRPFGDYLQAFKSLVGGLARDKQDAIYHQTASTLFRVGQA